MTPFLKLAFIIAILLFSILLMLRSSPTCYTNRTYSMREESVHNAEYLWPTKRLNNLTDFSESLDKSGNLFWKSIKPNFKCPPNLLTRVGGSEDGGKWTCGLSNLAKLRITNDQPPCVVYSFGVNNDSSFEAEILATTHCKVYAYDPSVEGIAKPLHPSNPRIHFHRLGIGGDDTSGYIKTLKTFMQLNGGHKWIDILKMDVEYAEYVSLLRILGDFPVVRDENGNWGGGLPFGQLLIEMHVKKANSIGEAGKVIDLFKKLEARGLQIFYKEINPIQKGNLCSEFSFINTNEFSLKMFLGN